MQNTRFRYNLDMEITMWNLFGRKGNEGIAGCFEDAIFSQKCFLRSVKKIRNRLSEIPMDERLIQTTGIVLDRLERHAKEISEDANNDWEIITDLLNLLVRLLGYDRSDGKVHREVFFLQKLGEELEDYRYMVGDKEYYDNYRLDEKRRYMLVNQLNKNKLPKYQIARLLGLSIKRVNQILKEIPMIEKEAGRNIPTFE
jgi:hypothetical protein